MTLDQRRALLVGINRAMTICARWCPLPHLLEGGDLVQVALLSHVLSDFSGKTGVVTSIDDALVEVEFENGKRCRFKNHTLRLVRKA